MKIHALLAVGLLSLCGCATTGTTNTQDQVQYVTQWVQQRSGFIEAAVATTVQIVVYAAEKDSPARQETLSRLHVVSSNLDALLEAKKVDPDAVRGALKVDESYFDSILGGVANIYAAEYQNFARNGYIALATEILKAVSRGIADGSAQ